ncbi:class I SAM-dependent methyltransferase [Streptomyces prunicolor]|uniref:Class I SAM-dependent methyltransferase n=1 Tax=Streptomyces prunicolor TaxID=67348 RepID=A0ABU4FEZ5_9ACTN|nr:class I SAM-dependent methyltransferase [Streptomyces prunicolor]MDV7219167.1 class I SAM-dependent methyltransferase [Streptomyces prunicolor]
MLYFTRTELANTYGVSVSTAKNWVKEAREGKVKLDLIENGKYTYVAHTPGNIAALEKLAGERKKYRPHGSNEVVKPRPEFYEQYSQAQIYDIVTNLEHYRELPRQYNYFDGGARRWDEYTQNLASQDTLNMVTATQQLLGTAQNYLDVLLSKYKRVNVVDIGVGNAVPVRALISHLLESGKLGRYVALDISQEMLNIAEANIKEWFGDKVAFEGHEHDITREHYTNLLAEDYIQDEHDEVVNLVLLLGGTLYNLRDPDIGYRTIHESMGVRDILIHTQGLDSRASRRYFSFTNLDAEPSRPVLPPIHGFAVDILNIAPSFYELEIGYDEESRQRFERIRFESPLTIEFEFVNIGTRRVSFEKGDSILIWRFWQQTFPEVVDQFERNGFHVLGAMQTDNREHVLTISQIKQN